MADQSTPPPPPTSAPAPRTEPLAVWSLGLAIPFSIFGWLLSFFGLPVGVLAIIFGHVARSKIRKSGGAVSGMGMALAGLVVAYIGIVPAIVTSAFSTMMIFDMIKSDRDRLHDLTVQKKEIASDDRKLKVTTSGFWVKTSELNKEARLQVANKSKDMYLMVFTDAKSAVGGMTLEQRHQTADRKSVV